MLSQNSDSAASSNKRLAKNTVLLYMRTMIVLVVNLYMSRVVLDVLGVQDYGIYNVVGGIVTMFSVISASLSNSISRYITFGLGKKDIEKLKIIFSTSVNIQVVLSITIAIIVDTLGLYLLYYKLNIPSDRYAAALWVLQASLATFVINLISLPYNACIVAHEKLDAYAYISILDVFMRLFLVILLKYLPGDSLILYAVFLACNSIFIRCIYAKYCHKHFDECKYRFTIDKTLLKEMFSFAGWNFIGSTAYILNTQGVNLLSNVYFGVAINAARGIATQAESGVRQFVGSFTTALNPQITKTYAEGNMGLCFSSVRKGAKISFFLMSYFFIPLLFEADYVLGLWLKEVPQYASTFFILSLLGAMVELPGTPMTILAQATGKIKTFYIIMGSVGITVLPISWILFKLGYEAYTSYIVFAVVYFILVFVRLAILKNQIRFPVKLFLKEVLIPIYSVLFLSAIPPCILCHYMGDGLARAILVCILSLLSITIGIYTIGITGNERKAVNHHIKLFVSKIYNKKR